MATEVFSNAGTASVISGGTTAVPAGTVESWTVAAVNCPTAVQGTSQFRVIDPLDVSVQPEIMLVTNGTNGSSTWTVTRGAENTATVAHAPGFTVIPSMTSGVMVNLAIGNTSTDKATTRLRCVAIGDSTTAGGLQDTAGVTVQVGAGYSFPNKIIGEEKAGPTSWFSWACYLSGGRLLPVHNAGVSSDTTTGMVARFATDVVAYNPQVVFIGDAHNDFSSAIPKATTRANIASMVSSARQAGIMPILRLNYPENNGSLAPQIRSHNAWLKDYAASNGLIVVDTYSPVVDTTSTSGAWQSALTLDSGTHPNAAGAVAAGTRVVADLAGLLRGNSTAWGPWAPTDRVGAGVNLLLNPLFQDDVNADGKADNWAVGATSTNSLVTDAAVIGKVQQSIVTYASGSPALSQTLALSSTLRVGDRIKFAGLVKVTASGGALNYHVALNFPGTQDNWVYPVGILVGTDLPWSYFECETVVPSNATQTRVGAYWNAGNGTISAAQWGLFNMTLL